MKSKPDTPKKTPVKVKKEKPEAVKVKKEKTEPVKVKSEKTTSVKVKKEKKPKATPVKVKTEKSVDTSQASPKTKKKAKKQNSNGNNTSEIQNAPNTANKRFQSPNQRFQQQNTPFNRNQQQNGSFNRSPHQRPYNMNYQQNRSFGYQQQGQPFNNNWNQQQFRPNFRNQQQQQFRPNFRNQNQQQFRPNFRNQNQQQFRPNFRNQQFAPNQPFNNRGPPNAFNNRGPPNAFNNRGPPNAFNNRFSHPNPRFNPQNQFPQSAPNNRNNFTNPQPFNNPTQGVKRKATSLPGKPAEPKKSKEDSPEKKRRTIFVGNIPLDSKIQEIKNLFTKYGTVESVRFRGVPRADIRQSKKVALFKKNFHANRSTMNAYVVFKDQDDADKALEVNGQMFKEHCLRVNLSTETKPETHKNSIFVGNVPFDAEDDDLIRLFKDCGPIHSVKISRDLNNSVGRGFGYVNFESSDGVELALQMENVKLKDRVLRIKRSDPKKYAEGSYDWTSVKISNIPSNTSRNALIKLFKRCGNIINITFNNKTTNKHIKTALIAFDTAEAASRATKIKVTLNNRILFAVKDPFNPHTHVFLRDVPVTSKSSDIKAVLEECGPIKRCKLLLNPQPPYTAGFGIMEFETVEGAESALNLKSIKVKDSVINIESYVKDKRNAESDDDDDDEDDDDDDDEEDEEQQNGEENEEDEEMEQDDDDEMEQDDDDDDEDDDSEQDDNSEQGDDDSEQDDDNSEQDDDNSEQEGDDNSEQGDDDSDQENDDSEQKGDDGSEQEEGDDDSGQDDDNDDDDDDDDDDE